MTSEAEKFKEFLAAMQESGIGTDQMVNLIDDLTVVFKKHGVNPDTGKQKTEPEGPLFDPYTLPIRIPLIEDKAITIRTDGSVDIPPGVTMDPACFRFWCTLQRTGLEGSILHQTAEQLVKLLDELVVEAHGEDWLEPGDEPNESEGDHRLKKALAYSLAIVNRCRKMFCLEATPIDE